MPNTIRHGNSNKDPPRIAFGVELTPDAPAEEVVRLAKSAETAGADVLFVSNHYNNRDPFIHLASIAQATNTVNLGPGIINPYETHPVRIASQMATLDELSTGRAVCGIGAGDPSTLGDLGITRSRPARTVHESIDSIRMLLNGERVDNDGTFTVRGAQLNHARGNVPIFAGAQGPIMLRMSAAHANGILINAAHPLDYQWAQSHIEQGRNNRSDTLRPLTIAGFASVSIAEDRKAAREAARPPVAFITAGAPDEVLERHDLDLDVAGEIQQAISSGQRERAYATVTPEMIETFCIAGTPTFVRDRFTALYEEIDAIVAASPLGPDRQLAIELLADIYAELRADGVVGE